jgi:glycosyltransferase involved in cell wall biosynthesis
MTMKLNDRKIKVLHLLSSRGFYGMERVVWNLTRNMDRQKVTSYVALFDNLKHPNHDLARRVIEAGFPLIRVPCRGRIDLAAVGEVMRQLQENQIDVLHCHEIKSIVYGIAAAKMSRVPSVVTLHSWLFPSLMEKIYEPLIGFLIRFFDRIAVVSNAFESDLKKLRIRKGMVRFIPNGIDPPRSLLSQTEKESLKNRFGASPEDRVVALVGRLEAGKGHRPFLDAAALLGKRHPNMVFWVIGEGSRSSELKQYAARLGLSEKIVFTGFVEDMIRLYEVIDICVLPSLKEGLPMVILEAMGHGICVVTTPVGELKRIIRNNENGILLDQASADSILTAVDQLVRQPGRMKEIGARAQQTVSPEYLSETMARRYERLYENVIHARRG